MIGLKKGTNKLVLPPDQAIRMEQYNDVLKFESVDPSFTYPFNLPTEPNAEQLGFPHKFDSSQNNLKEHDGYEITLNGNKWFDGLLDVQEADEETTTASFRTRSGVLNKYKDVLISELVNVAIGYASTDPTVTVPILNALANSPVVFPNLIFQDDKTRNLVNSIPCFRISYILKQIFTTININFESNVAALDNDWNKWILFGSKSYLFSSPAELPANIVLSEYLPEITLGDFLASLRVLDASSDQYDANGNTYHKRNLTAMLDEIRHTDLSDELLAETRSQKPDATAVSFSFDSADKFTTMEKPEGTYRGEYAEFASLTSVVSPQTGDYAFLKEENWYYQYYYDPIADESYWREYVPPFQSLEKENSLSLTCKLVPVPKRNYGIRKQYFDGPTLITDNAGKVRLTSTLPPVSIGFTSPNQLYLRNITIDSGNVDIYSEEKLMDITAYTGSGVTIDLDLDFVETGECEIYIREEFDKYMPVVEAGPLVQYCPPFKSTKPRIAIYHGMQDDVSYSNPYAYACSDPYNSVGDKIGNEALRFHQSDAVTKTYWKRPLDFMAHTRVLLGSFAMNIEQLLSFDIFTKVRIKGVSMLVRLLKSVHTTDGLEEQEFEGYKVG